MTQHIVELTPELTVSIIDPNQMPKMWGDLGPLVQEACNWSDGESTPETVVDGICKGEYVLVAFMHGLVPSSILVLTLSNFPSGKRIMEVLLASGSGMKHWMKFEEKIAEFARMFGCASIRMIGRDGLQRMLPEWKRVAIVLERGV